MEQIDLNKKSLWTREEVISLLDKLRQHLNEQEFIMNTVEFDRWIENNLQ